MLSTVATASAQTTTPVAFTPGNYVVVRVGDGAAALSNAATAVYLQEYTLTGTLVQTIAVPSASSGSTAAFTLSGSAGTEGFLTRSADGRYLLVPGYNAAAGTAAVASTASATTNRVVGRVTAAGTFDASTRLIDAFSGSNIRSAASVNGSGIYAVGNNGGVVYVPFGNTTGASTTISTGSPTNDRTIGIFGGNLYVSSASTPTYGVVQVGSGLPTTTSQAQTLLTNVVPSGGTATSASPCSFVFTDQSATVPGNDVLYVADDGSATAAGGIQKWSLVNGAWTLNGTIGTTAAALRGLAGTATGSVATLMATSMTNLYTITDNAGYNAAPSTTTLPTALATAGTNTVFRGVALAPLATALATRGQASPQELALYPNPAQDVLTVALAGGSLAAGHQAEVRDLLGRTVLATTLPASGQLRLAGLAPGTYLLTVDGTLTRRISKVE